LHSKKIMITVCIFIASLKWSVDLKQLLTFYSCRFLSRANTLCVFDTHAWHVVKQFFWGCDILERSYVHCNPVKVGCLVKIM